MAWISFVTCAAVIFICGYQLTRRVDLLSHQTGIGHAWLGAILLGGVTSLPEFSVTLSATALVGSTPMAIGNIFGSNLINLAMLAFFWLIESFPKQNQKSLVKTCLLSLVLLGVAMMGLLFPGQQLGNIGIHHASPTIVLLFLAMMYLIWIEDDAHSHEPIRWNKEATKNMIVVVLLAALVVVAGFGASLSCDKIAEATGMGKTFAGALFLGISTSLPELSVTLSAIAAGAGAMAAGNIFGSNAFNLLILSATDISYPPVSIYTQSGSVHMAAAIFAVMMSVLASIALLTKSGKYQRSMNNSMAFAILGLYLLAMWITWTGE